MKYLKDLGIAISGIFGIEFLDWQKIHELIKFSGQSVIGILTIYYILLQIKKIKNYEKK